ncbi:BQ5605_C004g02754 [Microbotryum silenes-dioicae]|uniref:Peptidyl-prolyl cis-trans isomerase n=1 Tax=Microbotryum silenes-dioicae TaxID=796604 RepID=A0A2X0N2R9_9BASI|nr:BQ5605_C004g02754 [Microbotryum silenes-dioicae]
MASSASEQLCYIDFAAGNVSLYKQQKKQYDDLVGWLVKNGSNYGLEPELERLDDVGRESLASIYEGPGATQITLSDPRSFTPPPSLLLPRLHLSINTTSALKKTSDNFLTLLTNEKGLISKKVPGRPLKYQGSVVHRIEQRFIAQGGDLTRGDGSGGESIYGGTFNDDKEGLKTGFHYGTIAMANSGKNSNSSQFFLTLTSEPARLKKLTGKYVAFGRSLVQGEGPTARESRACLEALDALGDGKGGTTESVWIDNCGLL